MQKRYHSSRRKELYYWAGNIVFRESFDGEVGNKAYSGMLPFLRTTFPPILFTRAKKHRNNGFEEGCVSGQRY